MEGGKMFLYVLEGYYYTQYGETESEILGLFSTRELASAYGDKWLATIPSVNEPWVGCYPVYVDPEWRE
jgi:hypothetical protein